MGKCLESNIFLKRFMGEKTPKNHLAVSGLDESEFQGFLKWLDTVLYFCSWPHLLHERLPQLSAGAWVRMRFCSTWHKQQVLGASSWQFS